MREHRHFQKLLCASCEPHGAPKKLGAVWSYERHHWGLESLAEAKRLGSMVKDLLGFFLWVGPIISGPRTIT